MTAPARCGSTTPVPRFWSASWGWCPAQRALHTEPWDTFTYIDSPQSNIQNLKSTLVLRVRMALHTGVVETRAGDYVGHALNRLARILATGHGGQTLLSQATQEIIRDV